MQCVFYEYVFLFEIHKEDEIVLNTAHGLDRIARSDQLLPKKIK